MPRPAAETRDALDHGDPVALLIAELTRRRLRIAVAESLTGGLLAATLIDVPGASLVMNGGIVAYATELKRSVLGVDADLLARHGAVHPEVAAQMADRVRQVCAIDGRPADLGLATTGAAGPDPQDGKAVGTVYVGIASARGIRSIPLVFSGSRSQIRAATVAAAIEAANAELAIAAEHAE